MNPKKSVETNWNLCENIFRYFCEKAFRFRLHEMFLSLEDYLILSSCNTIKNWHRLCSTKKPTDLSDGLGQETGARI